MGYQTLVYENYEKVQISDFTKNGISVAQANAYIEEL